MSSVPCCTVVNADRRVTTVIRVRPSSACLPNNNNIHDNAFLPPSPTTPFIRPTQSSSSLTDEPSALSPTALRLTDFFSQAWVQRGTPEILYIKRATRLSDRWSAQVAFPGGRQELDDENSLYTAMRETWEEVGIDLAEKKDFLEIGQLDDREITTSLGKRLLMVLSPFGGRQSHLQDVVTR